MLGDSRYHYYKDERDPARVLDYTSVLYLYVTVCFDIINHFLRSVLVKTLTADPRGPISSDH